MLIAPKSCRISFRRDGLAANPAFGERHVLRQIRVKMMADHQHVEMLVNRVDRVRPVGFVELGSTFGSPQMRMMSGA